MTSKRSGRIFSVLCLVQAASNNANMVVVKHSHMKMGVVFDVFEVLDY